MTVKNPAELAQANKRLCIVGVFSDSQRKKFVFRRNPEAQAHRLSPTEFFDKVAPQLRFSGGETLAIGKTVFNKTKIEAPKVDADGKFAGHGVAIPVDSPLLDVTPIANASEYQVMQERGAILFKQLLMDLDHLQQFDQGSFSSALLTFSRWYMFKFASEKSNDFQIAWTDWEDMGFDHDLSSKILHFMSCCPSDEVEAEAKVKRALHTHADNAALTPSVMDFLIEGLRSCRRSCEAEAHDDPLIGKFISEGHDFLKDFPGSERGFHLAEAGGKSFLQYYSFFRSKSDRAHSFARNSALHSFLFVWLAGKYAKFQGQADARQVADSMYKLSIEGQGDKRIPGMTKEERLRNFEIVRASRSDLAAPDKQKLATLETYDRFQEALNREIMKNLQPPREFRREVLADRNQSLFVMLSQMAGGKAGVIFQEASKQCLSLVKVYRAAKNVQPDEAGAITNASFLTLFENLKTDENSALLEHLGGKLKAFTSKDDALKKDVCELIVGGIANHTKTFFDSTLLSNFDEIEKEIEELRDIYRLHQAVTVDRAVQADATATEGLGMAGVIITSVEVGLPIEQADPDSMKLYEASLMKSAEGVGLIHQQPPTQTTIGVPQALEKSVEKARASGAKGEIKDGQGKLLATVEPDADGNLSIQVEAGAPREQLLASDSVLEFGDESVKVVDADIKLDHLVASPDGGFDTRKTSKKFGSLSDCKRRIRAKYMSESESDSMFRQSARALTLGEYMLAAPKNQINLGIADLSNVLGVILDATEHIGMIDSKTLEAGALLDPDKLARMNLSLHYPVNNRRELQEIVQYHTNQCRALESLIPYLTELRDVRELFKASAGSDAELIVINSTVAEQADDAVTPFFIKEKPSVVYLTSQSVPTQKAVQELGAAIVDEAQRRKDRPVVPLVFTPAEIAQENLPFPVFSSTTFKLPALVSAASNQGGPGLPVTGAPIAPYLAMAMALLGPTFQDSLGKVSGLTRKTDRAIADTLKLPLERVHDGRFATELLLDVWASLEGPLLGTLILSKWLNLCLADDVGSLDWLTDDCRGPLRDAYANGASVAAQAFRGISTQSIPDLHKLEPMHSNGNALSNNARKVALNSGELGVLGLPKKSPYEKGFGKLPFLETWTRLLGKGSSAEAEEESK